MFTFDITPFAVLVGCYLIWARVSNVSRRDLIFDSAILHLIRAMHVLPAHREDLSLTQP